MPAKMKTRKKISEAKLTVRLPQWLMVGIDTAASNQRTSTANFVRLALMQAVQPVVLGHNRFKETPYDGKERESPVE